MFETGKCKRFANVNRVATRKLAQLDAAQTLEFLRSPPGNRLRINDQYRLCFRWTAEGPTDVEIVDYH
jgi:toxin HigB-1